MKVVRGFLYALALCLALGIAARAADTPPASASSFDQVVDRMTAREAEYNKSLENYTPLIETYIQNLRPDADLGSVPNGDSYFLGRVAMKVGLQETPFGAAGEVKEEAKKKGGFLSHLMPTNWFGGGSKSSNRFISKGFADMIIVDNGRLDRAHYDFRFVRREFLGEVRTIVMDITPKKTGPKNTYADHGMFLGRVWVEDQDYNIVRANGTYVPSPKNAAYLHFDTWRLQMGAGLWLPAYVYSEESALKVSKKTTLSFKAQTRLWGFDIKGTGKDSEFTTMTVEASDPVKDQSAVSQDLSPVQSQRAWERQAEDNVIERLARAGLIAPEGEVDRVLTTVLNNVQATNNLDIQPEIRARVLLTAPLESFTIGHTIVISRGFLDVLPDEASLAAVLTHELSHIVLGHRLETKYAFNDRLLFNDQDTFAAVNIRRTPEEEADADKKAMDLLSNSPYKEKLGNAGLFLAALQARSADLPNLLKARMGNFVVANHQIRMGALTAGAPQLAPRDATQMAALPLGARIKLDPWSNKIEILKTKALGQLSAREKMQFEVTPVFPYLTRQASATAAPATTAPKVAAATGTAQ
jgi:hypothetical protein